MKLKDRFFSNVRGDVFGGVTAGIVALPLALGFGVASGLENGAAAGMYGAIAVGLLAALFGGTPSQISGPTGPMTVVVAGLIGSLTGDPRWIFVAVIHAGGIQVLLGLLRVGRYINYIPYPVVSGFMSGIGVIIIVLQMAQLVGHSPAPGTVEALRPHPRRLHQREPLRRVPRPRNHRDHLPQPATDQNHPGHAGRTDRNDGRLDADPDGRATNWRHPSRPAEHRPTRIRHQSVEAGHRTGDPARGSWAVSTRC